MKGWPRNAEIEMDEHLGIEVIKCINHSSCTMQQKPEDKNEAQVSDVGT